VLNEEIWSLSRVVVQTDGSVKLHSARFPIAEKLPWDQRSGSLLPGIATAPASVWGGNDRWASAEGSWVCVTTASDGTFTELKMELKKNGDDWSGTYSDPVSGGLWGALVVTDVQPADAQGSLVFVGGWKDPSDVRSGQFAFSFSNDLCSFSGGWTQNGTTKGGGTWRGER
jgi:hypothetical protein